MIDWRGLQPLLSGITFTAGAKGGRPSLQLLLVVKCLLLQSLYHLSDDAREYQVNDRMSFKRFVGLHAHEKSPDAKTLWVYRERIKGQGLHEEMFVWFLGQIESAGYRARTGQIVDATFVPTHIPIVLEELGF